MVPMRAGSVGLRAHCEPAVPAVGSATVSVAPASVSLASRDQVPADALLGGTPRRAGETCLRRRRGRQAPALPARLGVGAAWR
jgi:hypothetical protein